MKKKRKQRSKVAILKDKCWKLMSIWVRKKNADYRGYVQCVTCGRIKHYKEMDAGHLRHGVLDFDEININPQCDYCNRRQSGQRDLYYRWAVNKHGLEVVEAMYQRASMAKKGEPYTQEWLEQLAIDLTLKISELN